MKTQIYLLQLFLIVASNGLGQATAYCFPDTGKFNTGSTDGIELTEKSLIKTQSGGGEVGWARFNISSIPVEAIIQNVQFNIFISENNNAYWSIMSMENDPLLGTPSSIYNDCTNGIEYFWWEGDFSAPGWAYMDMWSEGTAGFQNSLQQGWFAMSFWEYETPPIWAVEIHGWNEPMPPYLMIVFELPCNAPNQAIALYPESGSSHIDLDAELIWTFGENTDSYDLFFGTDLPYLTKWIDDEPAGDTGFFNPGQLYNFQTYYWQIVSRNNSSNMSTPGELWQFNTDCPYPALPLIETFDDLQYPDIPPCWYSYLSDGASVISINWGGYSGSNSLYMFVPDSTGFSFFISPKIKNGLVAKYLSFFAKGNAQLSIGTMADPHDATTYNEIELFSLPYNYEQFVVNFESYSGTGEHLSFRAVADYWEHLELDNVMLNNLLNLKAKVFLEGPFKDNSMATVNMDLNLVPLNQPFNTFPWYYDGNESVSEFPSDSIIDWILVEIRDAGSPGIVADSTILCRQAAFVLNNGNIINTKGDSVLNFPVMINKNLFLTIWHRNHLGIISNQPLYQSGGIYSYDFTCDENQVYGGINGHKELAPGIWGMISGDYYTDGYIDTSDNLLWKSEAARNGYYNTDGNLDNQIDNKDKNDYLIPNLGKGTQVPE